MDARSGRCRAGGEQDRVDPARVRVLLKFFELEARFPRSVDEVPIEAVDFVGRQLDIRFDALSDYDWSGSSWKRHRRQIRGHFGFRAWSADDTEAAIDVLVTGAVSGGCSREQAANASRPHPPKHG